jgi:endonuclease YncB( thermonuclease family)
MGPKGSRVAMLGAVVLVSSLAPVVAAPADAASSKVTWTTATVIRWVDGDTVRTSKGTVRLIGFDAPERGRCGSSAAVALARRLAPVGSTIRLGNPASVVDTDAYGRKLRYVERRTSAGRVDIALRQLAKGSKARYDGRDGYQWHPRQARYRSADARHGDYRCGSGTGGSGGSWASRVNSPVSASNPDIDCGDIPSAYKPIRITGPDYHRLDADGDGWGCDSG